MLKSIHVPHLETEVLVPATRRFPNARRIARINFKKLDWFSMVDLDRAVSVELVSRGYTGEPLRYIPKYETFDLGLFFSNLRHFIWINHDLNTHSDTKQSLASSPKQCNFQERTLFVPEKWGRKVLALIRAGIIAVKEKKASGPVGHHWHGHEVSDADMCMILFEKQP